MIAAIGTVRGKVAPQSQKGVDLCTRLPYNLATPRYEKVFFPKNFCVPA